MPGRQFQRGSIEAFRFVAVRQAGKHDRHLHRLCLLAGFVEQFFGRRTLFGVARRVTDGRFLICQLDQLLIRRGNPSRVDLRTAGPLVARRFGKRADHSDGFGCPTSSGKMLLLRYQWGFEGFVVSDWGAVHDRVAEVEAGMSLEMPGIGDYHRNKILEAVRAGRLSS